MKRPNVIICMCDQLRPFELGCYGNKVVKTPNIDKLASDGVMFDTAVTNNPVCVPARSCLLSGQYSRTCSGLVNNELTDNYRAGKSRDRILNQTIAEIFLNSRYRTAIFGKWHSYFDPLLCGFEHALYPAVPHKYKSQTYFCNNDNGKVVNGYGPDFEMNKLEEFVFHNKSNPFFIYYNISLPHMPILEGMPSKYSKKYSKESSILRENVPNEAELIDKELWYRIYLYENFYWEYTSYPNDKSIFQKYPIPKDFDISNLTALYYGAIEYVDHLIGRLTCILEQNEIMQDTLIVFLSDHGENLGSHGCFNKDRLYEESIRIPMIFHWKNSLLKIKNINHIAQIIDIMPTVLDLSNITIPDHVQGRSLLPLFTEGKNELKGNKAFIETPLNQIAIRTSHFKYGVNISPVNKNILSGGEILYDLQHDPFETKNLINISEYSKKRFELSVELMDWNQKTKWFNQ